MKIENKASVTSPSIQQLYNGQPQELPGSYESTLKASFDRNTYVYRCVMAIAQAASTIPLVLYQKTNKELKEIEQHPLLDLLKKPNEQESGSDFFEKVIAFLMLSGNFYIEMNGPGKKSAPVELWAWRPDRTKIVPGSGKEFIKSYRYTVSGQDSDVEAARMIHGKFFAPLDDFYGLSPIQVNGNNIALNNASIDWNRTLMENHAAPSGFLTTEPNMQLSEPVFQRIKRTMRKMFSGAKNAGKPHLLEAGLKWQQTALSPKDADFIQTYKLTREEICSVFGVPPQIVGIMENSTYANYEQARASFYTETVMPTLDKVVDALNHKLAPLFGDALVIGYDKDKIDALQEDTDAKFKRMEGVKDILTINERREALGYEAVPYGDVILIPATMYAVGNNADQYAPPKVVDDSAAQEDDTAAPADDNDDPGEKMQKLLGELVEFEKKSRSGEYIKRLQALEDELIDKYDPLIAEMFEKWADSITAYIEKHHKDDMTIKQLDALADEACEVANDERVKTLETLFEDVIKVVGPFKYDYEKDALNKAKATHEEKLGGLSKLFKFATANIRKFITTTAANEIKHVTQTTKNVVKQILRRQVTQELSMGAVTKEIHEKVGMNKKRAQLVARTEVLAGSAFAAREGMNQVADDFEIKFEKEWSASPDERTRETHKDADGQRVPKDEMYVVGGHEAMYPHDPNLPPEERCNCRCAELHHVMD